MSDNEEFMKWFIDYMNKATLEDLKREPLDWKDRMLYLNIKFKESKNEQRGCA